MGMKVTGVSAVKNKLSRMGPRTNKAALRILRRGAKNIMELSRAQAPVDEGYLEEAHYIEEKATGINRRIEIIVGVDESVAAGPKKLVGHYATKMHEDVYNLGPKSQQKQDSTGITVGPKYLERAVDELYGDLFAELQAAVRRAIR